MVLILSDPAMKPAADGPLIYHAPTVTPASAAVAGNQSTVTKLTQLEVTRHQDLYLSCLALSGMVILLWVLCLHLNTFILQRTQSYYASMSANFRYLVEFVATVDVIFSSTFVIYYFGAIARDFLQGRDTASTIICYSVHRETFEWIFNVIFTAFIVALLRQTLTNVLYNNRKNKEIYVQKHYGYTRTVASHLYNVSTWKNCWTVACFIVMLLGPWVATSTALEHMPHSMKARQICMYNTQVMTILLPILVCVTVVSVLLISGLSANASEAIKKLTKPVFKIEEKLPNQDSKIFHCLLEKENSNEEKSESFFSQCFLFFPIIIGIALFIVLIIYGDLFSNTSEVLRSQFAITLTSFFQTIIFYCQRDREKPEWSSTVDTI